MINKALILFLVVLSACKQQAATSYVPDSSGNINAVTVVMPKADWQGELGKKIRKRFQEPYEGLPYDEPKFDLKFIPSSAFSGFAKQGRNILWFVKDSISDFSISQNFFAQPQIVGIFRAPDPETQAFFWEENSSLLERYFVGQERDEKNRRIQKSLANESTLEKRFGLKLSYPSAYKTVKDTTNFIWIEKPTAKGHNNILVYSLPLSAFDYKQPERILDIRDSIGKLYVPGRLPNTHLISERAYLPYYYAEKWEDRKVQITKATWEVANDFMAGPYVHMIVPDPKNDRWICMEGFAFAPNNPKRPAMFELETILRSVQWTNGN
ncbi:MAG: DUF4837 family protein [Flavobacteriaceae bacterium]